VSAPFARYSGTREGRHLRLLPCPRSALPSSKSQVAGEEVAMTRLDVTQCGNVVLTTEQCGVS
jgi:hypothetical protein